MYLSHLIPDRMLELGCEFPDTRQQIKRLLKISDALNQTIPEAIFQLGQKRPFQISITALTIGISDSLVMLDPNYQEALKK